MQPLTSDSEIDLNPSPDYASSLYLRCPRIRMLYRSLRDDSIPLRPRSPLGTDSSLSSPPPPAKVAPPDSRDVPNTCSVDVAPPSDEQLGLPSAVDAAMDDIPIAMRPLATTLWKAPHVSVLQGYTRSQAATAVAYALNLHRAAGGARAVLVIARVASTAKVWQQKLSANLDEVKVRTLRSGVYSTRRPCLNSLRMEQSPGVWILTGKALKDDASWNDIRQALRENRVTNTWDMVISEAQGGDSTLNLRHSPFRMVADKQARAGMFVMCSNEVLHVRKEQFSEHAVREFIQTQLPSSPYLSDESVWITPTSIGGIPLKRSNRSRRKSSAQDLEQLRRKADALVSKIQRTPPVYQQISAKEVEEDEDVHIPNVDPEPKRMNGDKSVSRRFSMSINASRTRKRTSTVRLPLQEIRTPTSTRREPRKSSASRPSRRVSPPHEVTAMRSRARTRRRSPSQDISSRQSYDRRSVSIIELSDDDESEIEWHTPLSQLVIPSSFLGKGEEINDSSDEEEWKTAYASRRKSRINTGRGGGSRAKSRNARLSRDHERHSGGRRDSELALPGPRMKRLSCALDAGLESPDTFPSTNVLDSEESSLDMNIGPGKRVSGGRKVFRRRRVSNERHFGRRLSSRRSMSSENSLYAEEEATPISSPFESVRRRKNSSSASSCLNGVFDTPTVRRNMSFVEILDSDIEVVDDREVINLISDDEDEGFVRRSLARNNESEMSHVVSVEHADMHTVHVESQDEEEMSYGSSLILTGVTKYNPQPDSLTQPERRKYNTWLRRARRAEARGPDGYDAAINLYMKCLTLCDEDDHLASRILSLTNETGILSSKDFYEGRRTSRISKRTRPPRRRLRRLCSSDSSS